MYKVPLSVTHTHSQLPYPYWMVPLNTADTLLISMAMPSPGCSSNALWPIDRLWISKLDGEGRTRFYTTGVTYMFIVCAHVCVYSLVQAVRDLSDEEQGLLPLRARVSGVLKSSLDHFGGFLIHCKDKSTCCVVICGDLIWMNQLDEIHVKAEKVCCYFTANWENYPETSLNVCVWIKSSLCSCSLVPESRCLSGWLDKINKRSQINTRKKNFPNQTHTRQQRGRWACTQLRWICRLKRGPAGSSGMSRSRTATTAAAAGLCRASCTRWFSLSENWLRCRTCGRLCRSTAGESRFPRFWLY